MAEPTILQLFPFSDLATNKQYLVALTEGGRIFRGRREVLSDDTEPIIWREIVFEWPDAIEPRVQFVQILWISTGNYLLGLKDDGTLWKAANPAADPLVWVEVSS